MMDSKKDTGWYCRCDTDSVNPWGQRLTTIVCRYPRLIHAAVSKHRMLSISGASSRAIPVVTMLKRVRRDPVIPMWTTNQKGMQGEPIQDPELVAALTARYLKHVEAVCDFVEQMSNNDKVHKQNLNRLLEPYTWIDCVISATDWNNLFGLRIHHKAQDEFEMLAKMIYVARHQNTPKRLEPGQWHLPLVTDEEKEIVPLLQEYLPANSGHKVLYRISGARCARTSYARHDGNATDWKTDAEMGTRILAAQPREMVPFEHQATPYEGRHGNFHGWKQARKLFEDENIERFEPTAEQVAAWEQEVGQYIDTKNTPAT
jgi:hypothetical protein